MYIYKLVYILMSICIVMSVYIQGIYCLEYVRGVFHKILFKYSFLTLCLHILNNLCHPH